MLSTVRVESGVFFENRILNNDSIPHIVAEQVHAVVVKDSIKSRPRTLVLDSVVAKTDTIIQPMPVPEPVLVAEKQQPVKIGYEGKSLPFTLEQTDGVFVLFLICFLLFAHIYKGGFSFFKENFRLVLSNDKDLRTFNQGTAGERWNSYLLVFQFIVLTSISIYDVLWSNNWLLDNIVAPPLSTIIAFIVLISVFILLKSLLLKFIGLMLDIPQTISVWLRTRVVSLELLGIFYFIPTLFLIYSDYWHEVAIGFMVVMFVLSELTLFYKVIVFFIGKKFNFLYLIAYLCSVEILPYVFLVFGLIYLYKTEVFSVLSSL